MQTSVAPITHALIALALGAGIAAAQAAPARAGRAGIEAFNDRFADATRRMDDTATLALWEEDGVSLLPAAAPIRGKPAISAFIAAVTAKFPGAWMETFTNRCFDIEVSGPWGSEWCVEHQVVRFADGQHFDGRGKMLLVLHRGPDSQWRIAREMWNQAAPDSTAGASPRDSSR